MATIASEQSIAVVTGANRGLGLETCRQLAQRGHRVVLTSRREQDGRAAAHALGGSQVAHHRLDVTQTNDVRALAGHLGETYGEIDVLINNAAVALSGFDADVARSTLAVNAYGPMSVTNALSPLIRRGGRIVMVSSGMGSLSCLSSPDLKERFADPQLTRQSLVALLEQFVHDVADGSHAARGWPSSTYRVSKVALNALTRILARELAGNGVLVNAVCPGWVRTDMGGRGAARSVEQGAKGVVWAAMLPPDGPSGGFFRDGKEIAW